MSDFALPPHLRGKLHNDWIWPLKNISRGWNAYGPRAERIDPDWRAWPPKLIRGKSVCRWETSGSNSVIEIPGLNGKEVTGSDVYGRTWLVIERNPGHPNFMKSRDLFIPPWAEIRVWDEPDPNNFGRFIQKCDAPDIYSPSALQKFSMRGHMRLRIFGSTVAEDGEYRSGWRVLEKREQPVWPETGDDSVFFWRSGFRPDHVDLYYNSDRLLPIGFAGLKWE